MNDRIDNGTGALDFHKEFKAASGTYLNYFYEANGHKVFDIFIIFNEANDLSKEKIIAIDQICITYITNHYFSSDFSADNMKEYLDGLLTKIVPYGIQVFFV